MSNLQEFQISEEDEGLIMIAQLCIGGIRDSLLEHDEETFKMELKELVKVVNTLRMRYNVPAPLHNRSKEATYVVKRSDSDS